MNRISILASIAAIFSLVSCADRIDLTPTPEPEPEPEPVKYVPVVLSVGLDTTNIDTKTHMTDQDTIGKVSWSAGDILFLSNGVITGGEESEPLAADSIKADGKSAHFVFMLTEAQAASVTDTNTVNYLYYGDLGRASYSGIGQGDNSPLVLTNGKPSSVRISATQTYAGNKCFADFANMALGVTAKGQTSCVMKNVFAILKIKASLNTPAAGDYIDCMQLTNNATGDGQYLAGTFNITFASDNTPQLTHVPQSGGESFTIQNIVPASESMTSANFYFLVPPKTLLTDKGFNVLVYTRNGYYGGKKVRIRNAVLNQNKITTIELAFNKKTVPEPGLPSANSFIIAAEGKPGIYTIPADYKGNSFQGNGDNINAKSLSISGGVKAEIIWQTKLNGDVVRETEIVSNPVYVTKSATQHFISFYCSGKEGNALVALKDNSGNIKWSWHLWITSLADSTDIQAGKWLKTASNRQLVELMDRNVGALSADPTDGSPSHGLHYQFGRKDPFMGSRFTKTQNNQQHYASFASISPETAIFCWQEDDANSFTYASSVQYPFVRNLISGGKWTLDGNPTYWGSKIGNSVYKSLDDPCPYGWMVLDESNFDSLFDPRIGSYSGSVINNGHDGGYSFYLNDSQIYFPGTGYSKDRYNVNEVGGVSVVWGGNYSANYSQTIGSQACFVQFSLTNATSYQSEIKAGDKLFTMPVRCQRWTEPANPSSVSTKSYAGSGAGVGYVSLDDFEIVTIE